MNRENTPLLKTKLYVPPRRPNLVSRPYLMDRLGEALRLHHRLTLISAKAGSGKTTLVSEWLHQQERPYVWLSLDENDNDPQRFFSYLVEALRQLKIKISHAGLEASELPPPETLVTELINDITASGTSFILVLDDYHVIQNDLIHKALGFLIEYQPPEMHLILTTRVDPQLAVAQLRGRGQLTEIRDHDLRFTADEAVDFLNDVMRLDLSIEAVAAIEQRTEGWIVGLQMAAISARGHKEDGDLGAFIEAFSGTNRFILDYLTEEVLNQQSSTVHDFLLETSIVEQMCDELCDAVRFGGTAVPDSQSILVELERTNLFVISLDDERRWYRYHHLFADLLQSILRQHRSAEEICELHCRASQWYEQAGLTGPAVQHALAAQAFDRAAMLVEQVAPAMMQRSELARLLTWLEALPDDMVQSRPLLALYHSWGLFFSGRIEQAAGRLEAVESMLAADESIQIPEAQGHIAALRAFQMRESGDFASTIVLSRQALAHLPEQDLLLRTIVTFNLAVAHYFQDGFEPACQLLTEIIATGQTAQFMLSTLSAIYLKAQILRAQGSLQQALQICQEGLDLVARRGWQHFPTVGILHVTFGELLYERNELSTAAEYLEKGIQLGQEGGATNILIIGNVWLAWLRQTQGDLTGSQESIRAALQLIKQHEVDRQAPPYAACYQTRLWIAQGNLAAANHWAQSSGLNPVDPTVTYLNELEYITLARLLIAQGELESAETLLHRLYRAAAPAGRSGSLIEILILQAITFDAQKRSEAALSALAQALRLAEGEGFVRIFLDEGTPMVELLRRAVTKGLQAPYALHLLNTLGGAAAVPQPLVEPLSGRELEVLQLLAEGLSNKEIAGRLFVAPGTVKQHLKNICRKLDVHGRMQAVRRGQELKLL